MRKVTVLLILMVFGFTNAQEKVSANRFFYELTFKPKKDSARLDKVMTVLDITPTKSYYKDFTMSAQDSIMKVKVEEMRKTGIYKDISKSVVMPKFSHRIFKDNTTKEITYIETITSGFTPLDLAYQQKITFDWKILPEVETIGEYKAQKATTSFGGREWTAWFSSDIPLQDGPYKFHGLPGLIVKVEDKNKEYSWVLKGNEKVEDWHEKSYIEKVSPMGRGQLKVVKRAKFNKTFNQYKKDPFASVRPMLNKKMTSRKLPGSNKTIGQMLKDQEKRAKDFYQSNDNPIELK